jgi:subtilisin family serine protease
MPNDNRRVLVKLRSSHALAAADARANLRPLYDTPAPAAMNDARGLAPAAPELAPAGPDLARGPEWYLAELPEGVEVPWDSAHARVADQLGLAASDVLFAEPDLAHTLYPDPRDPGRAGSPFAASDDCGPEGQTGDGGRAKGPDTFGWHLGDDYTQLAAARAAVEFTDRRTRIAHIDTGYDKQHALRPERVLTSLERNFVDGDGNPHDSHDPDNWRFVLDNSGHGAGTLGILAGGQAAEFGGAYLGGAPQADVVPLRVADSVVLFRTSAFAQALRYAATHGCDVVTISMGGLPSRAWSEAVNEAYEAGVCVVAAAGNNVNGLVTRNVVYPARYRRVIAVCGVMADGNPYANLKGLKTLEGNYGPEGGMTAAVSAYTPNIPWPKHGCQSAVRLNGEGTSAATPQVAAAVALWYEKHKHLLPRDWRRVEAVRKALFDSAKNKTADPKRLGHGVIQASAALSVKPVLGLPKTKEDRDSFAFFRVITGLGVGEPPPREVMFNLELTQRWLVNPELQRAVPDPPADDEDRARVSGAALKKFMEAVIEDEGASLALRRHVAARYPVAAGARVRRTAKSEKVVPEVVKVCAAEVAVTNPPFRRLRVYAADPSFSARLDTASINEVALKVRWEDLKPGPVGEYLEVSDRDAAGQLYAPVDLNDPRLLAQDGWAPSEGNPAFHQQMVYAVAMTTISHFERALGRPVLWRHRTNPRKPYDDSAFVRRLKVRPHALLQANAFYSPQEVALLFGYFEATEQDPGGQLPKGRVYTCLSHDIIAHETTHAVLDGMQRRFNEPSNPDVLALHEAFADIVALMQHFTIPEVLESEIGRTRGDLETESALGSLAVQFGRAAGGRGALRDAIGKVDERGVWTRLTPDPADYQTRLTPHARGAVLVAAVFDAFIAIYKTRTADLFRIYTNGTGVLPTGAIHPDLVRRLADEAAKSARHVLNMCIRALDYIPPVDITFGEYLRGIITADADLVGDDRLNYRVAFVEAFRRRGIYPRDLTTLSVDTLRWEGANVAALVAKHPPLGRQMTALTDRLKQYADACFYLSDRGELFKATRSARGSLRNTLKRVFAALPASAAHELAEMFGLDPKRGFEFHELRRSIRVGPDGRHTPQIVASLTQSRPLAGGPEGAAHTFRGGATLVVDLSTSEIQYAIRKRITNGERECVTAAFVRGVAADPLRALMLAPDRREPFAALHALAEADGG